MNVWLLEFGSYSDRFVEGVYSTAELARARAGAREPIECSQWVAAIPGHVHGWQDVFDDDGTLVSSANYCDETIEITAYVVDAEPRA